MRGLLIEDDPSKASKIVYFIKENFPEVDLTVRGSYQSGIKEIFEFDFDFILLDMSIPTYDQIEGGFSGKPRNFGGRDIIKEMKRYNKKSHVKVITQYNDFDGGSISMKDLDQQLFEKYPFLYKGYIQYNSKQSEWEQGVTQFINTIKDGNFNS